MKAFSHHIIFIIVTIVFSSCKDEDIMLYHPEDETKSHWLLEKIDYPKERLGLFGKNDIAFSYVNDGALATINNANSDFISLTYNNDVVAYSKVRNSGSSIYYDSLLIKLDDKKCATYALHVTYQELIANKEKERTQNDSTHFTYDKAGYLIQIDRYSVSGNKIPTYVEKYKIENENLVEVMTSLNYQYTYAYDNSEHSIPAEFCHEMPRNTYSSSRGGCWLITSLPFLSEYLGKRSKNNVTHVTIMQNVKEGMTPVKYGDIDYAYTYDTNNLVTNIKTSGSVNGREVPENYITTFSYKNK